MRTPFRWLLLLIFVVLNGFIVFWAWKQLSEPEQPVTQSTEERQRAASELSGRTDKMADDLIAKWSRDPVVKLDSDDLPSAVESLPEAGCIRLPSGGVAIDSATEQVKEDLNTALTGLLQAYREGTPDALIKYMRGRGKIVDPSARKRMERGLLKQGMSELEKLTDEDVYRTAWITFKTNAHWSGLVAESSCRQIWDGKNVPFNLVRSFRLNFIVGKPSEQMDQAEYLVNLLRGTGSGAHNFVSATGSLDGAHKSDAQVVLCDVQLVIELDESFSHARAPYLFRFWFNPALNKWQPQSMIRFFREGDVLTPMQF